MPDKLLIGSDPEYIFVGAKKKPICTKLFRKLANGKIGCDGHNYTGEIRPMPEEQPLIHMENVHSLIKVIQRYSPKALAGNYVTIKEDADGRMGEPLGGHIHFGHSKLKKLFAGEYGKGDEKRTIWQALSPIAITHLFIEDNVRAKKRRGAYGSITDVRKQPHGFEYRTLGSWLCSPIVTAYSLVSSYAIIQTWLKEDGSLPRIELTGKDEQEFYRCNLNHFVDDLSECQEIIDKVCKKVYGKNSKEYSYLHGFNNLIKRGKIWDEENPFPPKWSKIEFDIDWVLESKGRKILREHIGEHRMPVKIKIMEVNSKSNNIETLGLPNADEKETQIMSHAIFIPTKLMAQKPRRIAREIKTILINAKKYYNGLVNTEGEPIENADQNDIDEAQRRDEFAPVRRVQAEPVVAFVDEPPEEPIYLEPIYTNSDYRR